MRLDSVPGRSVPSRGPAASQRVRIGSCWVFALALLLVLASATSAEPPAPRPPTRLAYLFAAHAYEHLRPLPNTTDDIERLAVELRSRADFDEVRQYPNPTREDFIGRFREDLSNDLLSLAPDGHAFVLVLFVGHGMLAANEDWMVPVDGALTSSPSPIDMGLVPPGFIIRELKRSSISLGVLVVDACRTRVLEGVLSSGGPMTRSRRALIESTPAPKVAARLTPQSLLVYSVQSGRNALTPVREGEIGFMVSAVGRWLPVTGESLQQVFFEVSAQVRQLSEAAGVVMIPDVRAGDVSGHAILTPSADQLQKQLDEWNDAVVLNKEAAVQSWARRYPLGHQIPLATSWLARVSQERSAAEIRGGQLRLASGCRWLNSLYQCPPAAHAFKFAAAADPYSASHSERASFARALASSEIVEITPADRGVRLRAMGSMKHFSAQGELETQHNLLEIDVEGVELVVPDALRPKTWIDARATLFPCRIDRPVDDCWTVTRRRFDRATLAGAHFEVLAVASAGGMSGLADRLQQAEVYSVALAARLVRAGVAPDRISHFHADAGFAESMRGYAFVRVKQEKPK